MTLTARQQQIVETAMALIAEKGIQNLTIKNIASRIGVTEPAVYRHFTSKDEIVMTLLDSFEEQGNRLLQELQQQQGTALQKLAYFIFDRYQRCAENPDMAKVMFSEEHFQGDARYSARMMGIMRRHKEEIHRIIVEGQEKKEIRGDVSPTAVFRTMFGAVRLLVKQWCLSGFAFDLLSEGKSLWSAHQLMLKP